MYDDDYDNEFDDDLEDWVEDEVDDDEPDVLQCPSCKQMVHEDTQQCPHCGDWITPVYPGRASRKLIWAIAVVMVILAFVIMMVT